MTSSETFIWKIENFTHLILKEKDGIYSPDFIKIVMNNWSEFDETHRPTWGLGIQRSAENRMVRCVYLNKMCIQRMCDLALLGSDGSVIASVSENHEMATDREFHLFVEVPEDDIFGSRKNEFLPGDTLTVRCRPYVSTDTSVIYFLRTQTALQQRYSYLSTLQNFSTSGSKNITKLLHRFLDIDFVRESDEEKKIRLQVYSKNCHDIHHLQCKIFLIGVNNEETLFSQDYLNHSNVSGIKTWDFPFSKSDEQKISRFLRDDELTVRLELTVSHGRSRTEMEGLTCAADHSFHARNYSLHVWEKAKAVKELENVVVVNASEKEKLLEQIKEKLSEKEKAVDQVKELETVAAMNASEKEKSLEQIKEIVSEKEKLLETVKRLEHKVGNLSRLVEKVYEDRQFTDSHIRAGDETFPVHRAVLSARSEVFKAFFTKELTSPDLMNVDISPTDVDSDTMSKILLYAYTDVVDGLCWESATKLYIAAKLYEMEPLKEICLDFLRANICHGNVCELFQFSHREKEHELMSLSRDFILQNPEIITSDEWQKFRSEEPQLSGDVLQTICTNQMKGRLSPRKRFRSMLDEEIMKP